MTRNGKIARLPGLVRNELNQRLDNGEESTTLLPWLNGLPAVQKCLQAALDGHLITKQNLSEWRQGGFSEWQFRRELIAHAQELCGTALDLDENEEGPLLAANLALALAARYAVLLNTWDGNADPSFAEKLRFLHALNLDIATLQRTLHQASKQRKELEQEEDEREKRIIEERKKEVLAPIMAEVQSEAIEAVLGGGQRGKVLADIMASVLNDIPLQGPKKSWGDFKGPPVSAKATADQSSTPPAVEASPTESNQVKPGATQSKPVAPSRTQSKSVKPGRAVSSSSEEASAGPNEEDAASSGQAT